MTKKRLYMFLPFLWLSVRLPFFEIRTTIMCESQDSCTIEYSSFKIRIYKWEFEISLYDTMYNRKKRGIINDL